MKALQTVSVIVVLKCIKQFLLVRRHEKDESFPGKWQNLGGKVEAGERIEESIERETYEEVGIKLRKELPIFVQSYSWNKEGESEKRLGLVFLICLKGKPDDYNVRLCDELSEFKWMTLGAALQFDKKELLIGRDSPTGTLAQLIIAQGIAEKRLLRPTS